MDWDLLHMATFQIKTEHFMILIKWLQQEEPYIEESSQDQLMMDLILTRLRHADGIPVHELSLLGYSINISALQQYMEHDMLEYSSSNRLKLGPKGMESG